jgi:hypothetical protein
MKISHEEMVQRILNFERHAHDQADRRPSVISSMQLEGKLAALISSVDSEKMSLCAQARWRLMGDLDEARADLARIASLARLVIKAINDMPAAMAGKLIWDGYRMEYFLLNPMLIGLLLAGARKEFTQLCEAVSANNNAFEPASRKHIAGEFVAQLADVGAGINDRITLAAFEHAQAFGSNHFMYGYHEMLLHLAHGDATEFERVRAEREAAFPARVRRRPSLGKLDNWGYGKIAQGLTFDAMGVALCRLAVWRGIPVTVNSLLYPQEFYRWEHQQSA